MSYGKKALGLERIVAILSQDNHRSSRLLERLGFSLEGNFRFPTTDEELHLYAFTVDPSHRK
jgi:RimJ/RimL family protein N-acetyltransferase